MNYCLFLATLCFSFLHPSEQGLDQKRLLRDLFEVRKYNVLERPARNDSNPVTVYIAFNLQQIINLDEKDQYLDSSVWIEQYWIDSGLIWNPTDYGGISRIRLAPATIWRPDILMYNSANEKFDGTWPVNVVVQSSGSISYIPPAMLRSICKVNIRWFPFDEQYCVLKFGSWTYDDAKVNISLNDPSYILDEDYVKNGEFFLVERDARRYDKPFYYGGITENYPYIALCFHLQRLSLYYYFNLIIPAALISVMALLVFTLPVDSGEKMGLSVTIQLSLTVFNMVVAEFVPRTSEALPLLGIYFTCTMYICSVAVATSVWVLNLYYFPTLNKNPPYWIRYGICYYLARFLHMEIPKEVTNSARLYETKQKVRRSLPEGTLSPNLGAAMSESLRANVLDLDDDDVLKAIELEPRLVSVGPQSHSHNGPEAQTGLRASSTSVASSKDTREKPESFDDMSMCKNFAQFQRVLKELKVLANKVRDDGNTDAVRSEWRFASRVIDRACLLVFSLINILCTVLVLLCRPPESSGHDKPPDWPC